VEPIFFFLLNKIIFSLKVNFDVSSSKTSVEFSSISVRIVFSVFDRSSSLSYFCDNREEFTSLDKDKEL